LFGRAKRADDLGLAGDGALKRRCGRCFLLGNSLLDLKYRVMPFARSRLWRG
jgi:hypothetical protein